MLIFNNNSECVHDSAFICQNNAVWDNVNYFCYKNLQIAVQTFDK